MAPEGQLQLGRADPRAVVAHGQTFQPGALELDRDPPRAAVERVLEQLLERRGGPLDDLAGGDLARHRGRQLADPGRRVGWVLQRGHPLSRPPPAS